MTGKTLKDKGYAVDCLWHIDDVQQMIECDDETAIKILNESLESDNVCEVVYEMLDYIALNEYKVKLKEQHGAWGVRFSPIHDISQITKIK